MKKFLLFAVILLIIYFIYTSEKATSQTVEALTIEKEVLQDDVQEVKETQKEELEEIKIYKKHFEKEDPRQDLINYAYKVGWKDFLLTLDGENWLWTTNRKSNIIWANWYYDFGICQLNKKYHKDFINSQEFQDPYKQVDYCFGVWQDAIKKWRLKTTFYAYRHRLANIERFENLK